MTNTKVLFVLIVLIATATFASVYLIASTSPTGFSTMQVGKGKITFKPVPTPTPPPGGHGGGGGAGKPSLERPCPPAFQYWTDGSQAGILFADYDPELMTDAEIVVTVLDTTQENFFKRDNLRVLFIDNECKLIKEVNLGAELPNKIFTFRPSQYVDRQAKIIIQSIDETSTVNNPIVGKMYINDESSFNLLGARANKPWTHEIELLDQLSFTNEGWQRLPNQAYTTHLFPGEYHLPNIFEPSRNVAVDIGQLHTTFAESCIKISSVPDVPLPAFARNKDIDIAIKEYNAGEKLSYGTGSFGSLREGPSRTLFGNAGPNMQKQIPGEPDSRPQAFFATVGEIKNYADGTVEDWLVITNIADNAETVDIRYYEGKTCAQSYLTITVPSLSSQIVHVSDLTHSKQEAEGAILVTSTTNKRDLIVEKYGVLLGDKPQAVYKLNAVAPFRDKTENGFAWFMRTAPRQFMALVPSAKTTEDFTVKLINLPALAKAQRINEKLILHVTDGLDGWRSFELFKAGCVVDIDKKDLNEWAYQRTWLTHPQHLAIFGEWKEGGPVYATDVLTMMEPNAKILENEPGFMIGETFGNCCVDDDCGYRWNLHDWTCGTNEYYGENICVPPEGRYSQAMKSKETPLSKEFPAPPPPPPPPTLMLPIPFTKYQFPWWYFILGLILLLLGYYMWKKANRKPARKHRSKK